MNMYLSISLYAGKTIVYMMISLFGLSSGFVWFISTLSMYMTFYYI